MAFRKEVVLFTPEWLTNIKVPIPKGIFFGTGGNRKLGNFQDILSFSRHPGLPEDGGTCPAASTEAGGCLAPAVAFRKDGTGPVHLEFACYGLRGKIRFWIERGYYVINSTEAPENPEALAEALDEAIIRSGRRRKDKTLLRFHPVGDFDTVPYIESWEAVLAARPWIDSFGFSRSWRIPLLRNALDGLRALPNVQMLASMDRAIWNKGELPPGWFRLPSGEVRPVAGAWKQAWMGEPVPEMRRYMFSCPEMLPPDDPRWMPSCRACGACWLGQTRAALQGPWFQVHQ